LLTDPEFFQPIGFAKLTPWKNEKGEIVCWELGSVWVDPDLRGHRLAPFLINQLINNVNSEIFKVPIIAVVTHDNQPSNKLFSQHLSNWQRIFLSAEETNNFNHFSINSVNIFDGWGKPSDIYWYNKSKPF
jgi:GNAT superfamily N-acetyltransferase